MAGCVGATGLIFDGRNDAHNAWAGIDSINAEAVRPIEMRQRLRLSVAAIASLSSLVEDVTDFGRISRVTDPSLLIKDAHLDHARFVGNGLNEVVKSLSIVTQHVVGRAASDYIAYPLGAG